MVCKRKICWKNLRTYNDSMNHGISDQFFCISFWPCGVSLIICCAPAFTNHQFLRLGIDLLSSNEVLAINYFCSYLAKFCDMWLNIKKHTKHRTPCSSHWIQSQFFPCQLWLVRFFFIPYSHMLALLIISIFDNFILSLLHIRAFPIIAIWAYILVVSFVWQLRYLTDTAIPVHSMVVLCNIKMHTTFQIKIS